MKSTYRPEIDGLRAVAVVSVLLYHIDHNLLKGGYFGVDIFFVISGYLISKRIFSELDAGNFSIASFYERRARRILPALITVLASSAAAALVWLPPAALVDFSKSLVAAMFFVANIFFWSRTDYFAAPAALTPLLHTWSLSVEEQFYVLFPIAMMATHRYARRFVTPLLIGFTLVACALSYRASEHSPNSAFYLFQFRAWELLVGAIVARLDEQPPRIPILPEMGLILIAFSLGFLGSSFAALPVLGTALVIVGGKTGLAYWLLSRQPMLGLGLLSYSLYLWHQPVFSFARSIMINAPTVPVYASLIVLCVLLAYLSWRFVEQPMRSHRLSTKSFVRVTAVASVFPIAAAMMTVATSGFPERYTSSQLALLSAKPERNVAVVNGRNCRRMSVEDACIIGDASQKPTFAVLGDSHAEALTGPLSEVFRQLSISAFVYTYPACPFIRNVGEVGTQSPCPEFEEKVVYSLKQHGIKNVVINDRSTAYILGTRFNNEEGGIEPGSDFPFSTVNFKGSEQQRINGMAKSLRSTLEDLLASDIRIFYVAPIPEAGWNVPATVVKAVSRGLPLPSTKLDIYLARHKIVLGVARELAGRANFLPIYPHSIFCSKASGRCNLGTAEDIYYSDTDHLSAIGAKKLVDEIMSEIKKAGIYQP